MPSHSTEINTPMHTHTHAHTHTHTHTPPSAAGDAFRSERTLRQCLSGSMQHPEGLRAQGPPTSLKGAAELAGTDGGLR